MAESHGFPRVRITENLFTAQVMTWKDRHASKFQRLRYEYFVQKRQWVCTNADSLGLEYDHYDQSAHHIGVFDKETLLGYLRVLPWTEAHGFMLEHEFSCLLSNEDLGALRTTDALEVSRLVLSSDVSPEYCQNVVELLLKQLYYVAKQQQKPMIYMVVEAGWIKPFTRRFKLPLQRIGMEYTFPDGTKTVAAMTDIQDLEELFSKKYPEKLNWYQQL